MQGFEAAHGLPAPIVDRLKAVSRALKDAQGPRESRAEGLMLFAVCDMGLTEWET